MVKFGKVRYKVRSQKNRGGVHREREQRPNETEVFLSLGFRTFEVEPLHYSFELFKCFFQYPAILLG
jgi:hypothetical protein